MLRPALAVAALSLACADAPPALAPPDASLDAPVLPDAPARPPSPDVAALPDDAALRVRTPVQFGGPADDELRALAVAPSGELTVAVTFHESLSVGAMLHRSAGGSDVLLARLSADGDIRWTLRLGGAGDERAAGLALVGDEALVALDVTARSDIAGTSVESAGATDVAVARFAADGRLRHVARIGGVGDDHAAGVAALGDGAVVAITFEENASVGAQSLRGAGGRDAALAAFTAAGALRWARSLGGRGDDAAAGVAADGDAVYAAGAFEGLADYGGPLLTSAGGSDVWVASVTADGAHRWSRRFGGVGDDRAAGLAARGDLALAGSFEGLADYGGALLTSVGGSDGFVAVLSRDGAHRWSRRLGGEGDDAGRAIAVGADGAVVVAGESRGLCDLGGVLHPSRGGADAFVARYAAGSLRAEVTWGGPGDDGATALAVGARGAWAAMGFAGEAGVGGALVRSVGGRDVTLAQTP